MRAVSYEPNAPEMATWDALVDQLRALDVRYLNGGSAPEGGSSVHLAARDIQISPLFTALARASHPRLRDALVALLFRHPEYAPEARDAADRLDHVDRARLLILASIAAAAALQHAWKFTLDIYLPERHSIAAYDIVAELGVPGPGEDYGRASLRGLSDLLARDQPFPFDYARAWEDAAEHILDDLRSGTG